MDELRVLNQQLKMQIQQLESRVHELEKCTPAHSSSSSSPLLSQQFDRLLCHGDQIFNGPDTPTHFTEFSFKMVTEEIKLNAPDVFHLFVQLGNAQRHAGEDETSAEQRKAIVYSIKCLSKGKWATTAYEFHAGCKSNKQTGMNYNLQSTELIITIVIIMIPV